MKPALRVLSPGLMTTIQDFGRVGLQHLGVPVGGALDTVGLRAANALVGNQPNMAALEVAYFGPTLRVEADEARLAIAGADAELTVFPDETAAGGRRIAGNRSIKLCRGEVIRIGSLERGAVLYVAVEGGFDITPVMGSASTYVRGGFGGWQGRALAAGDGIPLCRNQVAERADRELDGLDLRPRKVIRAIVGPQADYFRDEEIDAFFQAEYAVGHGSDRMGIRLSGRAIRHSRGFDIVSDAIAPGAIQVPGNGQPIVLLADRQTTGGYPKIATAISADLPALGRLAVGMRLSFVRVTMEQAQAARRAHIAMLDGINAKIRPRACTIEELTQRLNDNNLVDGFIEAIA